MEQNWVIPIEDVPSNWVLSFLSHNKYLSFSNDGQTLEPRKLITATNGKNLEFDEKKVTFLFNIILDCFCTKKKEDGLFNSGIL
jgi:hypothetical protein